MNPSGAERLYSFLPLIHRMLDGQQGYALRALLSVIGAEFDRLHADIGKLYADWFIETCQEQVVPYLGDLVGIHVEGPGGLLPHLQRVRVANALRHRRRKGRADTLAQVIHEACGWSAVVREGPRRLATTQSTQHVHLERGRSVDVRQPGAPAPSASAGPMAHRVSVRGGEQTGEPQSSLNLHHVGILLSRTQVYPVERSEPWRVAEGCYTFHALGLDTPLYSLPRREAPRRELPGTVELPLPLSSLEPARLASDQFGPRGSVELLLNGASVHAEELHLGSLEHWHHPGPSHVGLRSGRTALSRVGPHPELLARMGEDGPHLLRLAHHAPMSLPAIARALEEALRVASPHPAFTRARVLLEGRHLLVLPGVPLEGDPVHFTPAHNDPHSVHALGLARPEARRVAVLLSSELPDAPAERPRSTLRVRLGQERPVDLELPPGGSPGQLARALRRQLSPHEGWHTLAVDERLLVLAEAAEASWHLRAEPAAAAGDAARWLGLLPRVAVDVRRGRLALSLGTPVYSLLASWAYGRAADVGAGPYPRDTGLLPPPPGVWYAEVCKRLDTGGTRPGVSHFQHLSEAFAAWNTASGAAREGLIRILDSSTYVLGTQVLQVPPEGLLQLEAAEGELPSIEGWLEATSSGPGARLRVEGVQARGLRLAGPGRVEVAHCSLLGPLVAGEQPGTALELVLRDSLLGPLRLGPGVVHAGLTRCLVHAREEGALVGAAPGLPGPRASMECCTVLGEVYLEALTHTRDCLFTRPVQVVRRQDSLLLWCALPWSSRHLPRHRCLLFGAPPGAVGAGIIASAPEFISLAPSGPGYGRLADGGPPELRTCAEDGGEPGLFHALQEERRLAALRDVLDEYLPVGLSAGLTFLE